MNYDRDSERHLDESMASLIKGMLARGDKQSDIAAFFLINGGRVSEINTKQRFQNVPSAVVDDLPPPADQSPSPFEMWRMGRELWRVRVALESARDSVLEAEAAVHKAEQRMTWKK
jgi:hypothetical protein